jgi:hypothetical protein
MAQISTRPSLTTAYACAEVVTELRLAPGCFALVYPGRELEGVVYIPGLGVERVRDVVDGLPGNVLGFYGS